ncbi:hypothetical protein JAAARDRAFT_168479 [Jaapia argillacea MUCL 33604]|uniref:Metallo-beta-lactamase domain-containing protein n=1 Tax=Jaapia argillacea MUCL 33604 TaxID=933084 RepID=A0A067QA58_9AGAM|nr:hypothetical protein JAAARDRAFT_168479 [Jaapia argillacea MUCL 33604]
MTAERDLVRVDHLTITFLVDNTIEWMTKLPPGFRHELRHRIMDDPKVDTRTGLPFVDLESYCCGAHGFSALIETSIGGEDKQYTLFDTGPDSRSLVRNVQGMKTPVDKIGCVVLSHWHSDHSGGLLSFLRYRREYMAKEQISETGQIVIDLHPDRPLARGISPPPFDRVMARLPDDPTFEEIETAGGTVQLNKVGHLVARGTVYVSGEIPRVTSYEAGIPGAKRWFEEAGTGRWEAEPHVMDERYALIDVLGKGLVIFTACSHAGVVNVCRDAVTRFNRPIHMVIGGLHLAGPEFEPRIGPTTKFFSTDLRPSPTYVLPMHCTGFAAKVALREALGDGCVPAGTGIKVDVKGDRDFDPRLPPPVMV